MSKRKKSTRKRNSQREKPLRTERYEEVISQYQLPRTVPPKWGVPPKNFWNPRILAFMEATLSHSKQDLERSLQSADVKGEKKVEPRELIEGSGKANDISYDYAAAEPQTVSFKSMFNLVKYIGKAIIIPIPSRMVSKMTFMPPHRNKYYTLVNYETRESYKEAKKAYKGATIDTIYDIESSYFKFKPPLWAKKNLPVYEIKVLKSKKDYNTVIRVFSNKTLFTGVQSEKIILLSQPNATDIGCWLRTDVIGHTLIELADMMECDIVAYDYNGYGASFGKPDEKACYRNVERVFKWITDDLTYSPENVILLGISLGTAVSIHLASLQPKVKKLILVAPFTSLLRIFPRIPIVGREPDSESTCCIDQFNSYDKAPSVKARTLLIHGKDDKLISHHHSEVLHSLFPNPCEPLFLSFSDHETILYQNRNQF